MKLSELANQLAKQVVNAIGDNAPSVNASPIMTAKEMAIYGRTLEPNCIALRVEIVANEDAGEMGRMELFVPVSRKALKASRDTVFSSVMRYIMSSVNYRAEMIGKVKERMAA